MNVKNAQLNCWEIEIYFAQRTQFLRMQTVLQMCWLNSRCERLLLVLRDLQLKWYFFSSQAYYSGPVDYFLEGFEYCEAPNLNI